MSISHLAFSHDTGRKEGNVLFKNALNTFYLWLYGIRYMVKDHSDSERVKLLLLLHGLPYLYTPYHRQDSTYHSYVIPVAEH